MNEFSLMTLPDTAPFTLSPALLLPEMRFSFVFPVVFHQMIPLVLSVRVFSTTTFCVEFRFRWASA